MMNIKKLFFALAIAVLTIGATVSCRKEGKITEKPVELSSGETANCYVVSAKGTYSFPAVKGNSAESVGNVREAEVLWELSLIHISEPTRL